MCSKKSVRENLDIVGYTVPRFHDGKKAYVDFYFLDRAGGKIRRKKYHVDGIRRKRDREDHATRLISLLLAKLATGWRPLSENSEKDLSETESKKETITIDDALDKFIKNIERTGRKKTIQSYNSRATILRQYLKTLKNSPSYLDEIDCGVAARFLDWLVDERDISARTRNNYRSWMTIFFDFMMARKYITANPMAGTDKMREKPKKRRSLSSDMLTQLTEYLGRQDRNFLLAVMMEYYCFIRPNELRRIRINDISVKEQRVFVAGEISKNGRDGNVALNETIIRLMIETGCLSKPGDWFLFGKRFEPAMVGCTADAFNKRWAKVRNALGWSDEYQFYSLKDTGIRDLANKEGIVTARNQARHTDVSTTNKYLEGRDVDAPEAAKHFKGALG